MVTIIFESHSTTFDNEQHLASGWNDIELSPLGIEQAKDLGARRGKEYFLRAQTVDRLFRCKFYAGILVSSKYPDEVRGQHEAMITEEQFCRVQAIIDGRNTAGMTVGKRLKDNPDFPLRRAIKCGKCSGPLSGGWSKGRSKKYAYYVCKNRCGAPSIKVKLLNDSLIEFLRNITPTKEQLDVFLMLVRKDFNQNIALLQAKRQKAEQQITELKELRQVLVIKNLKGTYSDEMFQEQDRLIKEKLVLFEQILGGTIFDKYTMEDIDAFMREKFKDLGETYSNSEPGQRRVLLGSICPSGLAWRYPGLSNQKFSLEYQSIRDSRPADFAMSDLNANTIEPFLLWIFKLMEAYGLRAKD